MSELFPSLATEEYEALSEEDQGGGGGGYSAQTPDAGSGEAGVCGW